MIVMRRWMLGRVGPVDRLERGTFARHGVLGWCMGVLEDVLFSLRLRSNGFENPRVDCRNAVMAQEGCSKRS